LYVSVHKVQVRSGQNDAELRTMASLRTGTCGDFSPLVLLLDGVATLFITCDTKSEPRVLKALADRLPLDAFPSRSSVHQQPLMTVLYPGLLRCVVRRSSLQGVLLPQLCQVPRVQHVFLGVHGGSFETADELQSELRAVPHLLASGVLDDTAAAHCPPGALAFHVTCRRGGSHAFTSDTAKVWLLDAIREHYRVSSSPPPTAAAAPDATLPLVVEELTLRVHYDAFWVGLLLAKRQKQPSPAQQPGPAERTLTRQVPEDLVGEEHLDTFTARNFDCVPSRARAKRLADAGRVLINGVAHVTRGRYVRAGDTVSVLLDDLLPEG
jgi:hypothetical protein